jgi:hypothetical protein
MRQGQARTDEATIPVQKHVDVDGAIRVHFAGNAPPTQLMLDAQTEIKERLGGQLSPEAQGRVEV